MARISKPPEERRLELINAASELFNTKGYELTSVSDIVKSVGVAQGTFYYHFKSKEELLEALIENYVEISIKSLNEIVDDTTLTIQEKIMSIVKNRVIFITARQNFVSYIKSEGNEKIHTKLSKLILPAAKPLFKKIADQGNKEGFFNVIHPNETFEIIFLSVFNLMLSIEKNSFSNPVIVITLLPKLNAYVDLIMRLLNVTESKSQLFKTILQSLINDKQKEASKWKSY